MTAELDMLRAEVAELTEELATMRTQSDALTQVLDAARAIAFVIAVEESCL